MVTYDPRGMSWDKWCALTSELFGANQLGTIPEARWKDWVAGMQGIGYFVQNGVPDARGYHDWREWAKNMVGIMNISQNQKSVY